MDKTRKKNIRRVISFICITALVGVLAAMPLLARQEPEAEGPQVSILSGTAVTGSIDRSLIGGGTLTEETALSVTVPGDVKLTGFLVSNGDTVTEGTHIATVDRITVMNAITQVQETLEYLSEQIEAAGDTDSEETISALAGGTVKLLYAQEGDSVQNVMLEYGALAVLSLDGLMAVDFETESTLPAGSEVTVTFSDGAAVTGKVEKNLAGTMTVTLEDDGFEVDATVTVTDAEESKLGSGNLYIYSPWNATAYTGTVKTLKAKVGDTLKAGKALMELEDVGYSASYRQLIAQRQEYEDLMLELFKLYQTETVTASGSGVVSGIDTESAQLLAAEGQNWFLSLLANAPNGNDEVLYSNYVGKISAVAKNGWVVAMNPLGVAIADYLDLSGVILDETLMTETVLHLNTGAPIFALENGAWVAVEYATVSANDILLFAADETGNHVWSVLLQKAPLQPENPGTTPGTGTTPDTGEMPGTGTGTFPGTGSGTGSFPSTDTGGGFSGMGSMGGGMTQEPAFELYGLETVQIAAITPQNTLSLEITVDEHDVAALQVGMEAQLRIDALGGEKHTATVTAIGNTGTGNGGNSKFTVELTLERSENILSGMTATAVIVLSTKENVVTIPADALVEIGNETYVYTGYDQETETLTGLTAVTVGASDGETVEILSGLDNGQTYYYGYYDTLEISYIPDFGGSFGSGGMGFMFG